MSTATQFASASAVAEYGLAVHIQRVFRARREKVFAACTNAEEMMHWRAPKGFAVVEAHSDARSGGEHRVVVRGVPWTAAGGENAQEITGASHGKYLDVTPYDLIRFTWVADWAPGEESLVTIRLSDVEEGTLMEFTHDRFQTAESAKSHSTGWGMSLDKLAAYLEG